MEKCEQKIRVPHMAHSINQEELAGEAQQNKIAMTNDQIKFLYESFTKFSEFVEKIGSIRYSAIRNDVIEHCDRLRVSLNSQSLTYESVEFMIKNRIEKIIKNKKIKKNWSQEDVLILIWIISKYSDYLSLQDIQNQLDMRRWDHIASMIPGVKSESCMFKWLSMKKINLSENCWSEAQSNLLATIVRKYGAQNWNFIAQELYTLNEEELKIFRCPKQCRQHWNCYLNPRLKKGPWTRQQDMMLLKKIVENHGRKKWAEFVKFFNGRTENALKNRYSLILDKQIKNSGVADSRSEYKIVQEYLQKMSLEELHSPDKSEEDNNQTKLTQKLPKETKPARIMTLRTRNKKQKYEKVDEPELRPKVERNRKQSKGQQSSNLENREDNKEHEQNIKQDINQGIPQESPFQSGDNQFIRSEFSDFTPAKVENNNYFSQGDSNNRGTSAIFQKIGVIEPKFFLPSVENIQVVPFNIETFKGLKTYSKEIVPCEMIENRLYEFCEKH